MDGNDWSSRDGADRSGLDGALSGGEPISGGRVRRSTIERFNDELAVLDRPLEGDVEYYDDPPPSRPWRRLGAALGAVMLLGGGAAFAVMRWSSSAVASEPDRPPQVAVAQPAAPPAPAAPVPAPAAEAAPAPEQPAEPVAEPEPSAGRRDWAALRPVATRSKHARSHRASARHHHHHG